MVSVDFSDHVDNATFSQILEMDDDDNHEFSSELVLNFFEQADETFDKMEVAAAARDLLELSKLGHFLKGSSATLGFTKIKDNCQIIQQYGSMQNIDGSKEPDEDVCLKKCADALAAVKVDKGELEKKMRKFFAADST